MLLIITTEKMILIKKEDDETDDVNHNYIGDEYKDLIANIFKFELKNGDLHLTDFDNQKLRLTNIVKYLREKTIDACDRLFNFKLNVIIDD